MVTAEFTGLVNRLLDGYLGSDREDEFAKIAKEYKALPVGAVQQLRFFLHPEGRLLAFNWLVDEVTEFNEEWDLAFGLRVGSKLYPELESLLPPRPPGATDCASCAGMGRVGTDDDWHACKDCSGRGWLEPGLDALLLQTASTLRAAGDDQRAIASAIRSFLEQGLVLGLSPSSALLNTFDTAMTWGGFDRPQRDALYRIGWTIAEEQFPGAWPRPEE